MVRLAELVALAAADRRESARERARAAEDRAGSAEDRRQSATDLRAGGLDDLTGVLRRATGELALAREIHRSRRLGQPLVIAMIDIDGLKLVNDTQGHIAGDGVVRSVPDAITATLRAYDVVARWGGDEFVCSLTNAGLEVARNRIADIERTLHAARPDVSFTAGLAELAGDEPLESLISRADAALRRAKLLRRTTRKT